MRLSIDDALDSVEGMATHPLVEGANVDLEYRQVGNDVVLITGLERADSDHRSLRRCGLPRHDGLQSHHRGSCHDHGVDARLGHRPMGAAPEQVDFKAVGGRLGSTRAIPDLAGRWGHDVLTEDDLRLRESIEEAVVDHGLGALGGFLSGLEDGEYGAAPRRGALGQEAKPDDPRRTWESRSVLRGLSSRVYPPHSPP